MILEAGWSYVCYDVCMGAAGLTMLFKVFRSYRQEKQALQAELALAGRSQETDPGVQHDPILILLHREISRLTRRSALLSLLWAAAALTAFGLSIPAFAAAYHLHEANTLAERQQYTEASAEYLRAIRLNRITSEINTGYDWAITHQDVHIDTVLKNAEEKTRANPAEASAHNDLANDLMVHQEVDRAIQEYRRALAIKPDYPIVHNNLGLALQMRHQMQDAVAEFQQAITLDANNPAFRYNLARAYVEQNALPEAIAEYRKSMTSRPDFVPSYLALATVFQKTKRSSEAISTLEQLVREMQGDPNSARMATLVQQTLRQWKSGNSTAPVPAFDAGS